MKDENAVVIEAWNTVLFEKFCRFRHLLTHGLSSHSDELFCRYPPAAGASVLDIGCGFGDTTLALARKVGSRGSAAGVDCAANFIESARCDAEGEELGNTRWFVGDVQTAPLGGLYQYAFSRFGTIVLHLPGRGAAQRAPSARARRSAAPHRVAAA